MLFAIELFKTIKDIICQSGYYLCLSYSLICVILTAYGYEERRKDIAGAAIVYFLLEAFKHC